MCTQVGADDIARLVGDLNECDREHSVADLFLLVGCQSSCDADATVPGNLGIREILLIF